MRKLLKRLNEAGWTKGDFITTIAGLSFSTTLIIVGIVLQFEFKQGDIEWNLSHLPQPSLLVLPAVSSSPTSSHI